MNAAQRWPKLFDLVRLMVYEGCRPEELLRLQKADVNLEHRTLRIVKSKTNSGERTIRIRPEALEILSRLIQSAEGSFLLCSERNRRLKLSLSTVENWHIRVRKLTRIPCVIYDWRHTFATRAVAVRPDGSAGMNLATLAQVLGHANLRSVMKYVHPTQEDQNNAMDRLSSPVLDPMLTGLQAVRQ